MLSVHLYCIIISDPDPGQKSQIFFEQSFKSQEKKIFLKL